MALQWKLLKTALLFKLRTTFPQTKVCPGVWFEPAKMYCVLYWYSDTRMHHVRIYWVKLDTAQNNLRDVVPAPKGSRACQNQWTTQAAGIFVSCKHLAWAKPTNENVDRNLHDMKTMNTYQETGYISAQNLTKSIVSGQSIAHHSCAKCYTSLFFEEFLERFLKVDGEKHGPHFEKLL